MSETGAPRDPAATPGTGAREPFLARVADLFLRARLAPLLLPPSPAAGVVAVALAPPEDGPLHCFYEDRLEPSWRAGSGGSP